MDKKTQVETSPYVYEKPLKVRSSKKWASGAVVAAGFVYLTSQLAGAGAESAPFANNSETDLEVGETSSGTNQTRVQTNGSNKTSTLGSIQAVAKNPELGKLGKIESVIKWGNNSAPTGASNGGTTPTENISAPTSATGGGSGSGTTPGNTTSPTSATGGGSGSGTTPGNTTSPTGAASSGDNDEYESAADNGEDKDDEKGDD